MAIYFLTDGAVEKREFNCLFCNVAFDERETLNQHYLEAHVSAFSTEEIIMAPNPPVVQNRTSPGTC